MFSRKKKSEGTDGTSGEVYDSSKLHRAVNAKKVLKYLGKKGIDSGFLHDGDTPLHAYVRRQDKHKMECLMTFLVHADYDVDMVNDDGDSPLHLACKYADTLSARALLAFDATINGFNAYNETPLDIAYRQSRSLARILEDIGGREGVEILGELQVFGSHYNYMGGVRDEGEETDSFNGTLDSLTGSNEKAVGMQTPDCSVEMGITSVYALSSGGRSISSDVNEEGILRDNPFFPSIDENTATEHFPPSSTQHHLGTQLGRTSRSPQSRSPQSRSPRTTSPSKSPPSRSPPPRSPPPRSPPPRSPPPSSPPSRSPPPSSPPSRSPPPSSPPSRSPPSRSPPPRTSPSPRSRSPLPQGSGDSPVGSLRSQSPFNVPRSRSPSPLTETRTAESSLSPELERGDADGEDKELEELKRNYAMCYPVCEEPSKVEKGEEWGGVNGEDKEGEGKGGSEGQQEMSGEDGGGPHGNDKETMVDKTELMKCQGFVNYTEGEFFDRLDRHTQDVMEKGLEESLGDEGYAAWLQYREIQRVKRDRETAAKATSGKEEKSQWVIVDKETPRFPLSTKSILKDSLAPKRNPKRHKHVQLDIPLPSVERQTGDDDLPPKKPPRLRKARQNPESSMMRSISNVNPNMSVMESALGHSVIPLRRKMKKFGKRGHRILCLDGGGVKGLVQIEILRAIETLAGAPICDLFDWIVGTSTGGIVALGTVYAHLPLEDLRKLYFEMKERVFKPQSAILTTACDTEALEDIIKKYLGTDPETGEDRRMNDVKKPKVLVTAVHKATSDLPLVFFNNCFNDEYCTQEVWKVGRYTSAAPVFFKECDNYIDGGVIANNPCNFALTHIKQHLRKLKEKQKASGEKSLVSTDIACLCSVGCGIFPGEPIGNADIIEAMRFSKVKQLPSKIKDTVNMLTTALTKSEDQANMCRIFCEELEIPFHRLSPQVGEMIGTAETDDVKLCDSIICTKKMLYEEQDHLEELVRQLGHTPVPSRRITT